MKCEDVRTSSAIQVLIAPCSNFSVQGLSGLLIGPEDAVHEIDLHGAEWLERLGEADLEHAGAGRYCVVNSIGGATVSATPGALVRSGPRRGL